MKICRFNSDRLGVIIDNTIRDVTALQMKFGRSTHDAKSDAIIASLPKWRDKLEKLAAAANPIAIENVQTAAAYRATRQVDGSTGKLQGTH